MPQINSVAMRKQQSHVRVKKIETPEWGDGGYVYVRYLEASDARRIQEIVGESDNGKPDEAMALVDWCVLGICDKGGAPVFSATDRDRLLKAPLSVIQRCVNAILKINGLTEEGESERTKSPRRPCKAVRVRSRKRARAR